MKNVLIVSSTDNSIAFFKDLLSIAAINNITILQSVAEARKLLLEHEFDLLIINAPLKDETGESLSRHVALKGVTQVILVVATEYFDTAAQLVKGTGILLVGKPMHKSDFWQSLTLAKSGWDQMERQRCEDEEVRKKIEDIRIVDRAKKLLMSFRGMSEQQAHRYIEKQAMDKRQLKRVVAERILEGYEN